jgi:hypothetical protein
VAASYEALRFSLFSLFWQKIISRRRLILGGNLGCRRLRQPKNSQVLAVLSLFSAVLVEECKRRESGINAGSSLSGENNKIHMSIAVS